MELVTVYRIEDKDGVGCYNTESIDYEHPKYSVLSKLYQKHNAGTHAGWCTEISSSKFKRLTKRHLAGCSSMPQLFAWFGGFLPLLLDMGFQIGKYTVPKKDVIYCYSGKQIIFRKPKI